jgi:uncharacterized protein YjbI with pentapeptide repeats
MAREKEARKSTWQRGSRNRTLRSRLWNLTGFRGMTVRDWLQLLIVPLALVVISLFFASQQDQRQRKIEDQRAEAERALAKERAQDEALQAYLDQMSTLLLEKDLRDSQAGSEVRTLARARTLTVLRGMDGTRKGSIMQFLAESELIVKDESVLDLAGADLHEAILNDADLSGTELSGLDFNPPPYDGPAQLFGTNLSDADLSYAILGATDLHNAKLLRTDLSHANLGEAYLRGADLSDADLSNARLEKTLLYDPRFPEDAADLSGVNLSNAYLKDATVKEEQLEQAESLKGATMPNGQKYEDWLKDR